MFHTHPYYAEATRSKQQNLLCANVDGLDGSNVDAQRPQGVNDSVELRSNVPQVAQYCICIWIFVYQGTKVVSSLAFKLVVDGVCGRSNGRELKSSVRCKVSPNKLPKKLIR